MKVFGLILFIFFPLIENAQAQRPNIIFALADDWSWPHASIAGDTTVQTPTVDRIAREGIMFINAHAPSPSCTASRNAILTGQHPWRLRDGANLWSTLDAEFPVVTELLQNDGYHVGFEGKGWGPGYIEAGGRTTNPGGTRYDDFTSFMAARPVKHPFFYWFASTDPHRSYQKAIMTSTNRIRVPPYLPDRDPVREDLAGYYFEVERFDSQLGAILAHLSNTGELDNTLVVVTSDNGMPFPRCKATLYDCGTHVPLMLKWTNQQLDIQVIDKVVDLLDLAPTFLQVAGIQPPQEMTGSSLFSQIDPQNEKIDEHFIVTAMERHNAGRQGDQGYPMRALRTKHYTYIRNFKPERHPAGDPPNYLDIDSSPTKSLMIKRKDEPEIAYMFRAGFGKRPSEELYDRRIDPHEMHNVANEPAYKQVKDKLRVSMDEYLVNTGDPRIRGEGDIFETESLRRKYRVKKRESSGEWLNIWYRDFKKWYEQLFL
jgi:arylsulfatase A-like enzyme